MSSRFTPTVLLVLLASTAVPLAAGPSEPPRGEAAPDTNAEPRDAAGPLRLQRAIYEIDVLGPVAVGRLVREFVTDADASLTAESVGAASGLAVERLEVDTEQGRYNLRMPAAKPRPGRRGMTPPNRRQARRPTDDPPAREAVDVEAGRTASVRSAFRMNLPVHEGRFVLRLPALATDPPTGGSEDGSDREVPTSITVIVHHDEPLLHAASSTHEVLTAFEGDRTVVTLLEDETGNRDFEFEFALGVEDDPTLTGQASPTADGGHEVIVVLAPPMKPVEESVRPKQVLFVLDTSGSMARGKLDRAREALGSCLEMLREGDLLNVVAFDDDLALLAEEPAAADESARGGAAAWIAGLRAGGGTHLLPALEAVLAQPESADHHRMIVVLTDGAVQDRTEALALLEQQLGAARLFVIGIGEDVTRDAILQMAEIGRGIALFADDPEALDEALSAMFASVADPLAWDLTLDLGEAVVESVEPARLPDLYAGRPVTVRARVRGELPEEVGLEATTTGGLRRFTTDLADTADGRLAGPDRR